MSKCSHTNKSVKMNQMLLEAIQYKISRIPGPR